MHETSLAEIVVAVIKHMVYRSISGVSRDTRRALAKIVNMTLATTASEGQFLLNEKCVITP